MTFNGDIDVKFINLPKYKMFLYDTKVKRSSTNILKTINIEKSYPLLELVDKTYKHLNNSNQFMPKNGRCYLTRQSLETWTSLLTKEFSQTHTIK